MSIGSSEVLFVPSVKNLGVTLDCNLNMTQHVLNICRSAYIELRQLGFICHLLTVQVTQTLVCAFNLSRLDYCNCLLAGCPQFLIDRLQKVQKAAARLICRAKKLELSDPFFSRYTGFQSGHEYSTKFACFASMYSQALDHNTSLNFFICTLPVEISVPPQVHAFSNFLVLIPKHWSEVFLTCLSLYLELSTIQSPPF